jgi:Ca-activated chloride channel family protein|nr:VWA domain-containing protein [Kofleriaceae bacterium]
MTDWLDISFDYPQRALWAWGALVFVAGLLALELRARDRLGAFLSPAMQRRLTAQASRGRIVAKHVLILGALLFAVVAMMRPKARGKTETVSSSQTAADVMFVLDTSRSMLAEDTTPNRLARAKVEIAQLVSRLDGQRVGLIAFAGRPAPVCPLTLDHAFFNAALSTVDTNTAHRGGTRVGEAIKGALRAFPPGPGAKLIVLITDGDDQDPYTQDAAKAARDAGVKIVAVGLGSETGSTITLTDPQTGAKTTLMYDGKPVISKLDAAALQKITQLTEGAYIPAGTNAVDLDSIMESHVRPIVRAAADAQVRVIPVEMFLWPLLASFVLLVVALWVSAGGGDRRIP